MDEGSTPLKGRRKRTYSEANVASSSKVTLDDGFGNEKLSGKRAEKRVQAEKDALLAERQDELERLIDHHDDLVRERFHLEKFVTLVYYDPEVAKRDDSHVFQQYRENFDLFTRSNLPGPSRKTRHAQIERLSSLKVRSQPDLKLAAIAAQEKLSSISDAKVKHREQRPNKINGHVKLPGKYKGKRKIDEDEEDVVEDNRTEETSITVDNSRPAKARWKGKEKEKPHNEVISAPVRSSRKRFSVNSPLESISAYSGRQLQKPKRNRHSEFESISTLGSPTTTTHSNSRHDGSFVAKSKFDTRRQHRNIITIPPSPKPVISVKNTSGQSRTSRPTVAGKTVAGYSAPATPPPAPKHNIKRIKLIVNEPPPLISHPAQRPRPPQFGKSLSAFLNSYKSLNGQRDLDESTLQRQANHDAKVINKIVKLRALGGLQFLDDPDSLSFENDSMEDTQLEDLKPSDTWSSIVSSVSTQRKSKIINTGGKLIAAGIAGKIRVYWENVANKEDKAKAIEERRLRVLAKSILKEVLLEWKKVVTHIREEEKAVLEAEEKRIGRQHLDAILNQSGRILEAQQLDLLKGDISLSRSRTESVMSQDRDSDDSDSDSSDSEGGEGDSDDESQMSAEEEEIHDDSEAESQPEASELLGSTQALLTSYTEDAEDEVMEQTDSRNPFIENEALPLESIDSTHYLRDEDHFAMPSPKPLEIPFPRSPSIASNPDYRPKAMNGSGHSKIVSFSREESTMEFDHPSSKDYTPSLEELSANEILAVGQLGNSGDYMSVDSPIFESDHFSTPSADVGSGIGNVSTPATVEDDYQESSIVKMEESLVDSNSHPPDSRAMSSSDTEIVDSLIAPEKVPVHIAEVVVKKLNGFKSKENGIEEAHLAGVDSPVLRTDLVPVSLVFQGATVIETEPVAPDEPSKFVGVNEDTQLAEVSDLLVAQDEQKEAEQEAYSEEPEQEIEEPPWEVPEHLKPYAVARVDWDPEKPLKPPILLRGTLRPYQQSGMEWLVSLHNNNMNGILADEMGLGKTIQTIALLAHLACDRGIWGPHLIIVPTSVILNWEMEFKKFLPGFKILSYHGTMKRRQELRKGWNNKYAFNVCVTSYSLASRDAAMFRRKSWYYMILDEAHMIKNFRSQRWNILLMFKSVRRLLLTGTPLQNNLTELWALLQFLMSGTKFANLKEFGEWFSNPLEKAIEQGNVMDEEIQQRVAKLHTVLRPYLLRRLKCDVEKELPSKYDHLVLCRLSKRQRFLYDEFMSRSQTRNDLQSGVYQKIANILMQLRKVCNHPDLFEVRPIVTSFAMERSAIADFEIKELLIRRRMLDQEDNSERLDLDFLGLQFTQLSNKPLVPAMTSRVSELPLDDEIQNAFPGEQVDIDTKTIDGYHRYRAHQLASARYNRLLHMQYLNKMRCSQIPLYGLETIKLVQKLVNPLRPDFGTNRSPFNPQQLVSALIVSHEARAESCSPLIEKFAFATPKVVARDLPQIALRECSEQLLDGNDLQFDDTVLHQASVKLQIAFPDLSLLQYDCGKLNELASLLRERKAGGHRVLIFTQMTRILDILEIFLNYHGYLYLRLDGATKIEDRQYITERFNVDERVFAFISSSRSGGVGINLTGADTVIFYDSDFNPQMDRQCEDRAHRIGQIRDVHIYRFISQFTVEEAMLRKANQKRSLDNIVIQQGEFDWKSFFGNVEASENPLALQKALVEFEDFEDVRAAKIAEKEEAAIEVENLADFDDPDSTEFQSGSNTPGQDALTLEDDGALTSTQDIEADQDQDDNDEDSEGGSTIDYMLKFARTDWEYFREWKI